MKRPALFFLLALLTGLSSFGQDTLPRFSVRYAGNNRVIVGWVNPFPNMNQISIQRSHDSLQNFKTILTVADPKAVMNGFADTKAPNDHMYYRLFFVLEGGSFYFSKSMRPDTTVATGGSSKNNFRIENREEKKPEFVPSSYVFTNRDGYVLINLPDAPQQKYSIKFFEEDNNLLFEMPVRDKSLSLDKSNFFHAGWFYFELYNGDKLVERHKFYLAKDF